jgi:hypothetical protein
VTPEEFFTALDNRPVHAGQELLRVEVFAIRDEAGLRWVQLALHGRESKQHLTLRLRTGDTAQRAVMVLAAWLADPSATPDVFNVA